LLVPRCAVERREHLGISQGVEAVLHPRPVISILLGDVVYPTIVDTESGFAVLLWYNYHGTCPSTMARGHDVELQHLVDLISDDLPF